MIEERLDIELQLGRHQAAVAELEALVAAHPLRERLRGLLMLALYRSGRQADALRVFQEGRHLLADELGLEPGHELRAVGGGDPRPGPLARRAPIADRRDATPSVERYSIPEALTPLVGRDAELRELTRLAAEQRLRHARGAGRRGQDAPRAGGRPRRVGGADVRRLPGRAGPGRRSRRRPCRHRVSARPPGPAAAGRGDRRPRDAPPARQLRARDHDGRGGRRGSAASLPGPAPPRHEPRGAARRRRDHLAGAAARGRRRREPVRHARSGRRRAARALRRPPHGDRRHLLPARRAAAGHRARRGPHPGVPAPADQRAAERSVPVAHRRVAHGAAAPADAARGGRLELRTALRRRATRLRTAVGVPGRLRPGHGRGGLRGRGDRGRRSRRPHPRPRRQVARHRGAERRRAALHPAADAPPVRPGAAHRTRRRRADPERDGDALRRAVRVRAPPPTREIGSGRG